MPRIENRGDNVQDYCERTGNGSSTHDVCRNCIEDVENAGLEPYNGDPDGTDGWGGDVDHPPYEECDYTCAICHTVLTAADN